MNDRSASGHAISVWSCRANALNLYEDALARARRRGTNHVLLPSNIDIGEATRTAWVVQGLRILHHIRNAIFQLHEDIWAMVNAQPIARAQVLVDPHPHPKNATAEVREWQSESGSKDR